MSDPYDADGGRFGRGRLLRQFQESKAGAQSIGQKRMAELPKWRSPMSSSQIPQPQQPRSTRGMHPVKLLASGRSDYGERTAVAFEELNVPVPVQRDPLPLPGYEQPRKMAMERAYFVVLRNPDARKHKWAAWEEKVRGFYSSFELDRALKASHQFVVTERSQNKVYEQLAGRRAGGNTMLPIFSIRDFREEFTPTGPYHADDVGTSGGHEDLTRGGLDFFDNRDDGLLMTFRFAGHFTHHPNVFAYNGAPGGFCGMVIGKPTQSVDFLKPLSVQPHLEPLQIIGWSSSIAPGPFPMSSNLDLVRVLRDTMGGDRDLSARHLMEVVGKQRLTQLLFGMADTTRGVRPIEFLGAQHQQLSRGSQIGYFDSAYFEVYTTKNPFSEQWEYALRVEQSEYVFYGRVLRDLSRVSTSRNAAQRAMSNPQQFAHLQSQLEIVMMRG